MTTKPGPLRTTDNYIYVVSHFQENQDVSDENGVRSVSNEAAKLMKYPAFAPTWDIKRQYTPWTFKKYFDPALRADPHFPNLFKNKDNIKISNITPKFGTEVKGINLSELDEASKDELALLIAQRGVVVFRDQDFAERGPGYVIDFIRHFGEPFGDVSAAQPKNHPEMNIAFSRPDPNMHKRVFDSAHSSLSLHIDDSFVVQPAGYAVFTYLQGPDTGGDTLYSNSVEAFERLSVSMQNYLSTLHVIHGRRVAYSEKDPHTIHPLVRVHPVLKKKCLFVNRPFAQRIVELKQPESTLLLNFLFNLLEASPDLQVRVKWEEGSVAFWDNRRLCHSALYDWDEPLVRHIGRVQTHAERPVPDLKYLNDENYNP